MGTECSFDYIFVYDGDSFKSPLLGSFSGKTEPQQVIATSGSVINFLFPYINIHTINNLIFLYTFLLDANFVV